MSSEIPQAFKGLCAKCSHRKTCKSPCRPVQLVLNENNREPFEAEVEGRAILFPQLRRFIRESEFYDYDNDKPTGRKQFAFSTKHDSPFSSGVDFDHKQTKVFCDLFFYKKSYREVAEKYDCSVSSVATLYQQSKKRLLKVVAAMDRAKLARSNGKPLAEMTKGVRVFFLHSAFGMPVNEIALLVGISTIMVRNYINTTRDRILAGELELLKYCNAEDREAAKDRLAAAREKDRIRCAEKYRRQREKAAAG